jgi:hypothetical protein
VVDPLEIPAARQRGGGGGGEDPAELRQADAESWWRRERCGQGQPFLYLFSSPWGPLYIGSRDAPIYLA